MLWFRDSFIITSQSQQVRLPNVGTILGRYSRFPPKGPVWTSPSDARKLLLEELSSQERHRVDLPHCFPVTDGTTGKKARVPSLNRQLKGLDSRSWV